MAKTKLGKVLLCLIVIAAALIIIAIVLLSGGNVSPTVINSQPNIVEEQSILEDELLADYATGTYTFEQPYIAQDPYGNSPLTALVMFETDTSSSVSVLVKGKDAYTDMEYQIDGMNTYHEIPVVGLYAGTANEVELTLHPENGSPVTEIISIETENLPEELPAREVIVSQPEKMEPGWTLVNSDEYKFAIDANGDVRWFLNFKSNSILTVLPNGNLLVAYVAIPPFSSGDDPSRYLETNLLGKYAHYYFTRGMHHDVIAYGDTLIGNGRGDTLYQFDQETGMQDETIFPLWDLFTKERSYEYINDSNSLHMNALTSGGDLGEDILISPRNQHALALINMDDFSLEWIMGIPDDWPAEYQEYLFEPVGEEFEWFWLQHSPQVLPDMDDDPETIDILVLDNGFHRDHVEARSTPDSYSRMVQYRINPEEHSIEQIWQYGEERGIEAYSRIKSSAQYLPETGNYFGAFAEVQSLDHEDKTDGLISEVTVDKELVYEVRLLNTESLYRAQRVSMDELIPEIALGSMPGKYLESDFAFSAYDYPQVENVVEAIESADSLYHQCIQKYGDDCILWMKRAGNYGFVDSNKYPTPNAELDSVTLIDNVLHMQGEIRLPELQEKNSDAATSNIGRPPGLREKTELEETDFFLMLSSNADTFTYGLSDVGLSDPDEDGMSRFYVNYFNAGQLPAGEYEISFFTITDEGINMTFTNHILNIED